MAELQEKRQDNVKPLEVENLFSCSMLTERKNQVSTIRCILSECFLPFPSLSGLDLP